MKQCRWCSRPIHQAYLNDCYECRNLYRMIEKSQEVAVKMILEILCSESISYEDKEI